MKKALLFLLLNFCIYSLQAQQVGIGTNAPDTSAVLDIQSTSAGLLIPRMSTLQRSTIFAPKNGLMVYDINTNSFWFYSNGAWLDLSSIPDGTGTDDQKIDSFSLSGTNLNISLEGDNEAAQTLDLSSILNSEIGNVPFLTRTELDALIPENGQVVYNSTNDATLMWNGTNWVELSDNCFPAPSESNAGSNIVSTNLSDTTILLSANAALEGIGVWSSSNGGSFSDVNAPNSSFTGEICTNYSLFWTITTSCDVSIDSILVEFSEYTSTNAGTDQNISIEDTTVVLNASSIVNGVGIWTVTSGTGGVFSNINSPNATFTGFSCETYVLRWSVEDCSAAFDEVNIVFNAIPTQPTAGSFYQDVTTKDDTVYTLQGNTPIVGEGTWSVVSGGGVFSDIHDPNATFTATNCSSYFLSWTISTNCTSITESFNLSFSYSVIANAGFNQTITNGDTLAVLNANNPAPGFGTWSIVSGNGTFSDINNPNATFTGNSCSFNRLRWTVTGCNSPANDVFINFIESPSISNAGADIYSLNDSVVTLSANTPLVGTGAWSVVSGIGGSFSNINDPNAIFTGPNNQTYELQWTISSCSDNSSSIQVLLGNTIGQYAYGGTIFYVDSTGNHGLVVSGVENSFAWGCSGTLIPGADSMAIGYGLQNTNDIIAGCSQTGISAYLIAGLFYNGFSDWYLPSLDELAELHTNFSLINLTLNASAETEIGIFNEYWSSTEFDNTRAKAIRFFTSTFAVVNYNKSNNAIARPIRSF